MADKEDGQSTITDLKDVNPPSPRRKPRRKNFTEFQLYNPSCQNDLKKLLSSMKQLRVSNEEDTSEPEDLEASFEETPTDELLISDDTSSSDITVMKAKFPCNTCKLQFDDVNDQREHFKLDWHRYNLKRGHLSQQPVTEEEFGTLLDDLSSIDGSDDESESKPVDSNQSGVYRLLVKAEKDFASEDAEPTSQTRVDDFQRKSPITYFRNSQNEVVGFYRDFMPKLYSKLKSVGDNAVPDVEFSALLEPFSYAIIMISGGHFAAAIFNGNDCLVHKTFHSYTVRAKQGGSQGSQDSKSRTSHAKSAGASLRRYNELSFMQHIQERLLSWKDKLDQCDLIFHRNNSVSDKILFSGKNPVINKNSGGVKKIPFATKRPTLKEVKRVQSVLSSVFVYDNETDFMQYAFPSNSKSPKKKNIQRDRTRSPKRKEEFAPPEPAASESSVEDFEFTMHEHCEEIDFTTTLQEHDCDFGENTLKEVESNSYLEEGTKKVKQKKSKPPRRKIIEEIVKPTGCIAKLWEYVKCPYNDSEALNEKVETCLDEIRNESMEMKNDEVLQYLTQPVDNSLCTILHTAAENNYSNVVWSLLELGCDPSHKNKSGKFPYNVASSKDCRDTFRRFMGKYPEKFDYQKAQIPSPLTDEFEQEKAEKKRAIRKAKREKEKLKKMDKKEKEKELEEQNRFVNLSDREKRALAAEKRILGQLVEKGEKRPILARCFECACDITGKVPFEYNQNIFCSTKCLIAHRKKFPVPLSV